MLWKELLRTCLFASLALCVSCADLPEDFARLSLEEQVRAYEKFFSKGGLSDFTAPSVISSHGYPAAAAMLPYLMGEKEDLPIDAAVEIVGLVQLRGCSLAGTPAAAALKKLDKETSDQELRIQVREVLEDISLDRKTPEALDSLGAASCAPYLSPDPFPLNPELRGLPRALELEATLAQMLAAHESCRFPGSLRERIAYPPAGWDEIQRPDRQFCLGRVFVGGADREGDSAASFYLITAGRAQDEAQAYKVFASFIEDGWRLTWPVPEPPPE